MTKLQITAPLLENYKIKLWEIRVTLLQIPAKKNIIGYTKNLLHITTAIIDDYNELRHVL